MRQAGIIAAGVFALERMIDRLQIDHDNAKYLAEGLSKLTNIEVFDRLDINMVFFRITGKSKFKVYR